MTKSDQLVYYELIEGDYVQSGDEFLTSYGLWMSVDIDLIGKKYGYDRLDQNLKKRWKQKVRRLIKKDALKHIK